MLRPPESDNDGQNPVGVFPVDADMVRAANKFKTTKTL
jgi:hypothetical protein